MPSALALASLKALAGGPSTSRQLPTEDYGFSGAVPTQGELESPFEMEQARRAEAADARDRAMVERTQNLNADVNEYGRPDVASIRRQEDERKLAPIRLKGQFDVEAAKQNQGNQSLMNMLRLQNTSDIAGQREEGLNKRAGASNERLALQAQLNNLYRQRTKAGGSGISNLFGLTGPSEQQKLDTQIQALEAQILGGGDEAVATPDVAPAIAAPSAGGESAAQQLARLRSGRR